MAVIKRKLVVDFRYTKYLGTCTDSRIECMYLYMWNNNKNWSLVNIRYYNEIYKCESNGISATVYNILSFKVMFSIILEMYQTVLWIVLKNICHL